MKNNKILLAALAVALVLGMAACNNGSTGSKQQTPKPNTDPKSIKFTDFDGGIFTEAGITTFPCCISVSLLPEGTDMAEGFSKFVAASIWDEVPADVVGWSYIEGLSLWTADNKEWTGTGTYDVTFAISTAKITDAASMASIKAVYSAKSISFTTKETPVSWGKFEKQPLQ
jgi:hypothetical protein